MADPARDPHPDPDDMLDAPQVPGEVVEESNVADRRPDVNRLRAVRTGEGTAALYVGWPENSDTFALPARIYEQARAFAQATKREDRLPARAPLIVGGVLHQGMSNMWTIESRYFSQVCGWRGSWRLDRKICSCFAYRSRTARARARASRGSADGPHRSLRLHITSYPVPRRSAGPARPRPPGRRPYATTGR